jgi:hypothetical protein
MKNNKTVKEYAELQYKTPKNLTNRMNLWSYKFSNDLGNCEISIGNNFG